MTPTNVLGWHPPRRGEAFLRIDSNGKVQAGQSFPSILCPPSLHPNSRTSTFASPPFPSSTASGRTSNSFPHPVAPRSMAPSSRRRTQRKLEENEDYIPRPCNAFMIFRAEYSREHAAASHESGRPDGEKSSLSTRAAEAWYRLPDDQKKAYKDRAKAEKEEHARLYPDYRFRPNMKSRMSAQRFSKDRFGRRSSSSRGTTCRSRSSSTSSDGALPRRGSSSSISSLPPSDGGDRSSSLPLPSPQLSYPRPVYPTQNHGWRAALQRTRSDYVAASLSSFPRHQVQATSGSTSDESTASSDGVDAPKTPQLVLDSSMHHLSIPLQHQTPSHTDTPSQTTRPHLGITTQLPLSYSALTAPAVHGESPWLNWSAAASPPAGDYFGWSPQEHSHASYVDAALDAYSAGIDHYGIRDNLFPAGDDIAGVDLDEFFNIAQ